MTKPVDIASWLATQSNIPADLAEVVLAMCSVGKDLSRKIARGALEGAMGAAVGDNTDGDIQKALDIIADEHFFAALKNSAVRWYGSEEREEVIEANPKGHLALATDPLDGSSNIDVNVSIGTIFSIYEAKDDPNESFLRPGTEQIVAGYIIYGPQTGLMVSFGAGTQFFLLDPDRGEFVLMNENVRVPEASSEFAINASNYRHWSKPVRAYIDDCLAGETGPRGKNFNMRWVASLVAEAHRIITRGGIFLYPSDARKGYEDGRLRMVYECAPIAMLVEQAGGLATDGSDRLLEQTVKTLHSRTPLVFGTPDKVNRVATYHDLPDNETSALFRERGLFRD
ncbi:MAG: class 1 fructose-bisphosphatase [Alphaproteobacteria bacterium]|nr:class 1 fructose-bisphosphatase [Alphaproteobacteria bacterium]